VSIAKQAYGLAVIVWVLDRATKYYVVANLELGESIAVLPVFSWIRLHNTGAAFSFLSDAGGWQRWFFVLLAIGFAIFLVTEIRKLAPGDRWLAYTYGLILGGALGNGYDRLVDGYVVDFVLVHWQHYYFPAFNVADSGVSVGAASWILWMIVDARRTRRAAKAEVG
jgi:signal peptidase II